MSTRSVLLVPVVFAALCALAPAAFADEPRTREDGSLDNSVTADTETTPLTSVDDDFIAAATASLQRMTAGAELVGSRGDNEEVREFAAELKQRLDPLFTRLIALRGGSSRAMSSVDASSGDSTLAKMRRAPSAEVDALWLDYQANEYGTALAVFEAAAANASNTAEIRALSNEALPWLRSYSERLQQLRAHQAD